jgi:succinyl-CoA:(S)-malate CoA-transferase subunit B
MGCPELAGNGKWGKIVDREKDRLVIDQFVTDWTMQYSRQELLKLCSGGEVPCGPINSIEEIFTNEQFAARENIAYIKEPRISDTQVIAVPNVVPRLSATPGKIHSLGPKLGADVDSLLSSILAFKPEEIEELRQASVI